MSRRPSVRAQSLECLCNRGRIADVDLEGPRLQPLGGQRRRRAIGGNAVAVGDRDQAAFNRQSARDGFPDTGCTARDEGDAAAQIENPSVFEASLARAALKAELVRPITAEARQALFHRLPCRA